MYSLGEPYALSLDQIMYENYDPEPKVSVTYLTFIVMTSCIVIGWALWTSPPPARPQAHTAGLIVRVGLGGE
jgi:hypothetical protein